jgi:hypothetical protein
MAGMDLDPGRARRRNVALVFVAIGLLLLGGIVAVTAVGGGDGVLDGVEPGAAIRAAPSKVAGKRLRASFTLGTGGALQVQVAQNGVFDLAAQRSDVMVTGLGSGTIRIVADGPTLYVQGSKPISGKPWGRLTAANAGPLGSGLGQVTGGQINALLGTLAAVKTATNKGVETIGGQKLRHLASTLTQSDLTAVSPFFAQVGATGNAALDVYLDSDGAPRKIAVATDANATKVELTVTIAEIGKAPPVEIPPAADVADTTVNGLAVLLGR